MAFDNDPLLHIFSADVESELPLPYVDNGIRAGFPSPAQDYITDSIDLNREVVHNKECTFYARVVGDSMRDAGIFDGDLAIIDKSLEPKDGCLVAAYIDGGFTLKEYRIDKENNCGWLVPHNPEFSPIRITEDDDFRIWGVVTYTIQKHKQ